MTSSNPYEVVSQFATTAETGAAFDCPRRGFWSVVIVAGHLIVYGIYLALAVFVSLWTASVGFGTARADEKTLFWLFVIGTPYVAGLFVAEYVGRRRVHPRREPVLALSSLVFGLVPLGLATFWFCEFLAFGGALANGLPGLISLVVGLIWILVALLRLRGALRLTRSSE